MNKQKSMNSHKHIAITFIFLLLLCMFVWGDGVVRCVEREREALLSFKEGLIDVRGTLSSWEGEECCGWFGVVCSNTTGHVISLTLDGRYDGLPFLGTIGSSLLELHHLNYLDLSYNNFQGDRIPEFIGSMKQLEQLFLVGSNFSGVIPPQLGNLTNLRILSLSRNYLKSENLDWLSGLSLLSILDLSYSLDLSDASLLQQIMHHHSLQGLLLQSCNIGNLAPSSFSFVNSSSLSALDLSYNHLTSSVFEWLPNISTSLKRVSLSNNALGGQIPNVFGRLNLLEYLDLSNNTLEGEIPKSLGDLRHLQTLYFYNNKLRGDLDELFGNASSFPSLQILDLTRNEFSGSVPDLGAFPALIYLYLGSNKLTGSMPLSLGTLSKLQHLDVSRNSLNGTLSESHLVNLQSLKILDLSSNKLSVRIDPDWNPPFQLDTINLLGCKMGPAFPKWIQTQKTLSHLDLSSCGIVELPNWLWSFSPSLKYLFLANNQIGGELPSLSSTPIQNIDLSYNNISGLIPLFHPNTNGFQLSHNMFSGSVSSLCEIPHNNLYFLDLSDNMLAGEIPDCWEKMPQIFFLNLAGNTFTGEIPQSLGSFSHSLSILQLHGNKLSGELPSTLRFCQKLSMIDVSDNELSGNIPAWLGYSTLVYLNIHGNRFSGSISPEICNLAGVQVLDLSRNNLSGEIPNCFNNFISLADTTANNYFVGYRYNFRYSSFLPHFSYVKAYSQSSTVKWKGQEREYEGNLILLKLIDFSSNGLSGNIPGSFSSMRGLNSLNLSRNSLRGNIIPDIGQMEKLESLDLSYNQLSGEIPTSLARLYNLAVLDLSNNNLSGKIPTGTQLQGFNASAYAENGGLCGAPLGLCPSTARMGKNVNRKERSLSFMQEVGIAMVFGFIFGFWGVVGSFILKKPWRNAYFNFFDAVGDWFYVRNAIFVSKWRRS